LSDLRELGTHQREEVEWKEAERKAAEREGAGREGRICGRRRCRGEEKEMEGRKSNDNF
jgi:hypothetical protein